MGRENEMRVGVERVLDVCVCVCVLCACAECGDVDTVWWSLYAVRGGAIEKSRVKCQKRHRA